MSNELATVPSNIALPAYLQTPEMAAKIAADNAAAAGGIKAGGFPSISIKSNHFHEKEGSELKTYYMPAVQGQPLIPLMCLELVVVSANPTLSHTYFEGDWQEGMEDRAPKCRSSNGVTPDADVAEKQNATCANCPKAQWGSKISKISGKEIKACDDAKQLAVLPAADLTYKALGLQIHKGSLKNWGKYVGELNERGFPITKLVTNVTFDATQNGVLNFSFNRFLLADEIAKVEERAQGSDVKVIVAQTRAAVATPAALPPPGNLPGVTIAAPQGGQAAATAPVSPVAPAAAAPQGPQFPPEAAGFGAAPVAPAPATPPPAEQPKRTRAPRKAAESPSVDLSHLPPALQAAVTAVGADSPAGQAILAQFPPPVKEAAVDPFAGQPAHVKPAVEAAGGLGSAGGNAVWAALTGTAAPGTPGGSVTAAAPIAEADKPAVSPPPMAPPADLTTKVTTVTSGFGTTAPAASQTPPSPAVAEAAGALKAKLAAILAKGAPAGAK